MIHKKIIIKIFQNDTFSNMGIISGDSCIRLRANINVIMTKVGS